MSPFNRIIAWVEALGRNGATANARRAVDERARSEAAVDALAAHLAATARASSRAA
jgi:hypothetical protein